METPKLIKKYIHLILTQQYGLTAEQFHKMRAKDPKKNLVEILTTQGVLTKQQFLRVLEDAKQKVREFKTSQSKSSESLQKDENSANTESIKEAGFSNDAPLQRIGKYEIVRKIAQGGMGDVYQARHVELDQIYALKLIREGVNAGPQTIVRFHREAKISAKLKHPGIVQVIDSGEEQHQHYFVMEYVEGDSLATKIRNGIPLIDGVKLICNLPL